MDQARHIYKKVELEGIANVDTIKQEIEEHKLSKNKIDDDEEVNPYHNIIMNNIEWENIITPQMEQWSILSNVVNYVQHNRDPKDFYDLEVNTIDQKNNRKIYDRLKEEARQVLELIFGNNLDKLGGEYLDMYEGVKSEVLSTTKFDENSDLGTAFLGRIDMTRPSKVKSEGKFPISEQGYTVGKLLDYTECQILIDMGVSKSFLSKSHYLRYKSLHS